MKVAGGSDSFPCSQPDAANGLGFTLNAKQKTYWLLHCQKQNISFHHFYGFHVHSKHLTCTFHNTFYGR